MLVVAPAHDRQLPAPGRPAAVPEPPFTCGPTASSTTARRCSTPTCGASAPGGSCPDEVADAYLDARLGPEPLGDGFDAGALLGARAAPGAGRRSRPRCSTRASSPASATSTPTRRCGARACIPLTPAGRVRGARRWRALPGRSARCSQEGIEAQGASIRDFRTPDGGYGSMQERFAGLRARRRAVPSAAARRSCASSSASAARTSARRCQRAPRAWACSRARRARASATGRTSRPRTGCTVLVAPDRRGVRRARCAAAAPGTRETALLGPRHGAGAAARDPADRRQRLRPGRGRRRRARRSRRDGTGLPDARRAGADRAAPRSSSTSSLGARGRRRTPPRTARR